MIDWAKAVPATSSLGRWIRWPARVALRSGHVTRVLMGPARGLRWVVGTGLHGCWLGTYEWPKPRRFAALVQPGMTVYDLGANAGFYTLLAARRCGPSGQVYAFEPSPRNTAILRRHLALNRCTNVAVIEAAVSDRTGVGAFDDRGSHTGALTVSGAREVHVVSLDALWQAGRIAPPDVVKIDVEGAEAEVLRGAAQLLRTARPRLLLATHGPDVHRACLDQLVGCGYALESLDSTRGLDTSDELLARPSQSAAGV